MEPFLVARAATRLVALSVASPVLGLVVELLLASQLGSSHVVDAYRVSCVIALFGLNAVFVQLAPHVIVPLFSEWRLREGDKAAWRRLLSVLSTLLWISLPVLLAIHLASDSLAGLLAPGLRGETQSVAAQLITCSSASFVLLAWSAPLSSALYTYRLFGLGAATPLLLNLSMIVAIVLMGPRYGSAALGLGIVGGGGAVALLHLRSAFSHLKSFEFTVKDWFIPRSGKGLGRLISSATPLVLTLVSAQLITVLLYRCLSEMGHGTIANYGYASKLLQLTYLPGAALAMLALPTLSASSCRLDFSGALATADRTVRMTFLLSALAAAVLWPLRLEIVEILFGQSRLTPDAISEISGLFGLMLVAAPAGVIINSLLKLFSSMQFNWVPALGSLSGLVFVVGALQPAAAEYRLLGAAAVWSASMWANCFVLLGWRCLVYKGARQSAFLAYGAKIGIFCAVAVVVCTGARAAVSAVAGAGFLFTISVTAISSVLAVAASLGFSRILKIPEALELASYTLWQWRRLTSSFNGAASSQ